MFIKYKVIAVASLFQAVISCNCLNGVGRDIQGVGDVLTRTGPYRGAAPVNYHQAPQLAYKQPVQQNRLAPAPVYVAPKPVYTPVATRSAPVAKPVPRPTSSVATQSIIKRLTGNMQRVKISPYTVRGIHYTPMNPQAAINFSETGIASFYSTHSGKNAIGDSGSYGGLTCAHKTLPLPSIVRVTNLDNGKSVVVRVNDRGPFVKGRIVDLCDKTKSLLGENGKGLLNVRMDVMAVGDVNQITR